MKAAPSVGNTSNGFCFGFSVASRCRVYVEAVERRQNKTSDLWNLRSLIYVALSKAILLREEGRRQKGNLLIL